MLSHGGRLRLGSYYGQGQGGQHAGSEEVVRSGYVPTRSAVRSGTFQEAAYVLTCFANAGMPSIYISGNQTCWQYEPKCGHQVMYLAM